MTIKEFKVFVELDHIHMEQMPWKYVKMRFSVNIND